MQLIGQVLDGERGNDYRRQLLPSYKAHRRGVSRRVYSAQRSQSQRVSVEMTHEAVINVLMQCNVPVGEISLIEYNLLKCMMVRQ